MNDLIDRQKAIDAVKDTIISAEQPYAEDALRKLPSVEQIRKKGKWQRRKGDDCWECSECHAVLENSDIGNHNFYYCYHCGADMMDVCGYMDLEKANYE